MVDSTPDYTRLHITPLTSALLDVILPPSIRLNARNISYHNVETFPEKGYGYVEVPEMDAEKIKKKLNGSILKGVKVRIEAAKPKKELVLEKEASAERRRGRETKDSKKRKRRQETIPAVEIGNRRVKRGWTTQPAMISKNDQRADKGRKKAVVKSKYTTAPECLFKTTLPADAAINVDKKKRKGDVRTVVHEFEKTTKYATFLRGPAGSKRTKSVAEYVEGKGWVDENANVVEEITKRKQNPKVSRQLSESKKPKVEDSASEASSEVSSSSEEKADDAEVEIPKVMHSLKGDSSTSTSGSSSDEATELKVSFLEDHSEAYPSPKSAVTPRKVVLSPSSTSCPPSSSSTPSGLSITIPNVGITSTPIAGKVHPLEALYKRPHPGSLGSVPKPPPSVFNFFGADGDRTSEEESQDHVPETPFTQNDFESRGIRSAAPTPDTAHANKRFIWPTDNDSEEEEEEATSPIRKEFTVVPEDEKTGEAESEFQKWFYENRGETNRAWKKRRRIVAKEQRQRENRKGSDRHA